MSTFQETTQGTTQDTTLELVRFSVAPDREEEFLAAREAAVRGMRTLPGLLSATLARADDGSWLDLVLWRTREEALAAARAFETGAAPAEVTEWASCIEAVESMTHSRVVHSSVEAGPSEVAR
jgi:heme-degrading monooxygenase HmoA